MAANPSMPQGGLGDRDSCCFQGSLGRSPPCWHLSASPGAPVAPSPMCQRRCVPCRGCRVTVALIRAPISAIRMGHTHTELCAPACTHLQECTPVHRCAHTHTKVHRAVLVQHIRTCTHIHARRCAPRGAHTGAHPPAGTHTQSHHHPPHAHADPKAPPE